MSQLSLLHIPLFCALAALGSSLAGGEASAPKEATPHGAMEAVSPERYDIAALMASVPSATSTQLDDVHAVLTELNREWAELRQQKSDVVNAHIAHLIEMGNYQPVRASSFELAPGAIFRTIALVRGDRVAIDTYPGDSDEIDAVRAEMFAFAEHADAIVDQVLTEVR